MVRAIFNRWPHLQQELSNSQDAILVPDENLFQECLKMIANGNSQVLPKRAIFGKRKSNDGYGLPVIKRGGIAWEVENYLLSYQDGEDASTMDAHREQLHDQYNQENAKRDQQIIRKLIDLTFPHQRNLLIREMPTIREVINLYPLL